MFVFTLYTQFRLPDWSCMFEEGLTGKERRIPGESPSARHQTSVWAVSTGSCLVQQCRRFSKYMEVAALSVWFRRKAEIYFRTLNFLSLGHRSQQRTDNFTATLLPSGWLRAQHVKLGLTLEIRCPIRLLGCSSQVNVGQIYNSLCSCRTLL